MRWTGFVQAQEAGDYTFTTASDDGIRLWIDDKPVIDDWNVHALKTDTATVHFAANSRHTIRMEYFQATESAIARLPGSMVRMPAACPGNRKPPKRLTIISSMARNWTR